MSFDCLFYYFYKLCVIEISSSLIEKLEKIELSSRFFIYNTNRRPVPGGIDQSVDRLAILGDQIVIENPDNGTIVTRNLDNGTI